MMTTKPKITKIDTANVVTNLTAGFTPPVKDFLSSPKGTGKFAPHGLSEVKYIVTEENMAAIVSFLVGKRFVFSAKKREELEEQLVYFFNESGVANVDVLSIMINPSAWTKPAKLEDEDNFLALITVSVTLLLSQIASYT